MEKRRHRFFTVQNWRTVLPGWSSLPGAPVPIFSPTAWFLGTGSGISFTMADLGTLLHNSLDLFARKLREQGLFWTQLEDGERDRLAEACVDQVVAQAGESVLLSSARNAYTVKRAKRMVKRTVWALQFQLRQGRFLPALTEWAFGPWDNISSLDLRISPEEILHLTGRIDRIDLCREDGKVYVKVIDYKSGNYPAGSGKDVLWPSASAGPVSKCGSGTGTAAFSKRENPSCRDLLL